MNERSHEFSQSSSKDPKQIIDKAIEHGYRVYLTYRDKEKNETKRIIKPIEWVDSYKLKAFCELKQDERHFVLSGIREISLIVGTSSEDPLPKTQTPQNISQLDQWASTMPKSIPVDQTSTKRHIPDFKLDQLFNQVTQTQHWETLVQYYHECLNREYLQDYLIDSRRPGDYHFFNTEEDSTMQFITGATTFTFPYQVRDQKTDFAKFILSTEKRDQHLCLGFPSFLLPDGKIAPLFFVPCEIEIVDQTIQIRADDYEISYAVLQVLNLDKEEFATLISEMNQGEFDDRVGKIKALQNAFLWKLEEAVHYPIGRRAVTRARYDKVSTNQIILLTTPCLFWATKNDITNGLLDELEKMSKRTWESVPSALSQVLNVSKSESYPPAIPLARDNHVYLSAINNEQRQAIQAALATPITVVTGPPGTGKSQLVVSLIANAVIEGKSVLFASRNNQAVNVVYERVHRDMNFDGIIRTGNRNLRKEASEAMLNALSRGAVTHSTKDVALLLERYKQTKITLANQLAALEDIQRLKNNLREKTEQLDQALSKLPSEVTLFIKQTSLMTPPAALEVNRSNTMALIHHYEVMQKVKKTTEAVLQEHITDNKHGHAIISDLERFETQWGRFGENMRDANYFLTIEALQRYTCLWIELLDAADVRITFEHLTSDLNELQTKRAGFLQSIPDFLQALVQTSARSISNGQLNEFIERIKQISGSIAESEKASVSNMFGLRRSPQINVIHHDINALLTELGQPLLELGTPLDTLKQRIAHLKKYIQAVMVTRSIAAKQQSVKPTQQRLFHITKDWSTELQQQFANLALQHVDPKPLRNILEHLRTEIAKALSHRDDLISAFQLQMAENPSLEQVWREFQSEVGKNDHEDWQPDRETSLTILQHMASKWLGILKALDSKLIVDQVTTLLQAKNEKETIEHAEAVQAKATAEAIEILNTRWLQNIDHLPAERVQRVKDYASLLLENSEQTSRQPNDKQASDRQKYARLMSLQENNTEDIIAVFPVWATTNLSVSRNLPLRPELFDLVIIDEASQCDIPSALPLIYRAKRVVIIGDAKQLRHISTLTDDSHYSLAAQHSIATETYSYIQHSIFDLASRSVGQHPGILLLKEHYRSHSHIIIFANQMFYNNQLVIKTTSKNIGRKQLHENAKGIFWLDVAGHTQHPAGGSALNLNEIDAIVDFVPALRSLMEKKGWKKEKGEIGIVTPYRTQKQLIEQRLEAQAIDNIKVGTAHTFQGDEQEVLLFSPVLASGMSEGSLAWLRRTENLLNVAITRARTTLVIVGDFKFCMSLPEENPYRKLAQYVEARPNSVFQSWRDLPIITQ